MNTTKSYNPFKQLKAFKKLKGIGLLFLFLVVSIQSIQGYEYEKEIPLDPINTYDEVPVEIIVKGYLRFEADVIITDKRLVYVNVEELFKKLGIFCEVENGGGVLKGFIENERIPYLIDFDSKQITRGDRIITSENGIVRELGSIYVETSVLSEAFGLHMVFNFRSLSIKLEADFELPMVKQARLEKMRENITKLQSNNEVIIDSVIGRDYHFFNGGALDWSVASFQSEGAQPNNRFSLALGSELFYGEARVGFNYFDQTKFDRRQLFYNWRWIDNENTYLRQVQVGKIGTQSISFLRAPVVGASFNNSPNTIRKAAGTYTISDVAEPNWTVELYINDALVDYTSTDASGFYLFNVPIVYGYTTLTLKFYGPLGEERVEERTLNTPYTFMPANVLEYKVSGGILEDDEGSKFGRGEVNYGINRFVTIGGGVEYLTSIPTHEFIPFANMAFQPFSKMIVNMEYAHNVSVKGLVNYYFGTSAFLELDYKKFKKGQQATLDNMNEDRRIRLSLPYKLSKISGNTKLSFNQFVYDAFNFNQVDALISGRYKNNSANVSLASNWLNGQSAFMTSTVVLSRRFRNGLIVRPTIQYNISDNSAMRLRAEIEKRASKITFSAAYERNVQFGTDNVFLSFRYDLPYARTGFNAFYANKRVSIAENAQGSLAFGAGNGEVNADYNSAIGKGGILCYPFLDLNQNNKRDADEPLVFIKKVKISGGKISYSKKDSIVRISDLNSFITYNLTFSDGELDNIGWRFKHKTYQVLVDPNQYKKIDIPILVEGEVTGMVYLNKGENTSGQGRVKIQIFDTKGYKVGETLSESDGYYSYLGLKPGTYTIRIDEKQLKKLNYQSTPLNQEVTIKKLIDGDFIEGVDFKIQDKNQLIEKGANEKDTTSFVPTQKNPIQIKSLLKKEFKKGDSSSLNKVEVLNKSLYAIQLGEFRQKPTLQQLGNLAPIFYEVLPNGMYRFVYGKYTSKSDASNAKNGLMLKGVKGASIVTYQQNNKKKLIEYISLETQSLQGNGAGDNNRKAQSMFENMDVSFTEISKVKGSFYSVQIGVYKNKVTPKQLLNLAPIYYEILQDTATRYIAGKYNLKKEAKIAKNNIVIKGIKDAYVVAYNDGEKVELYELDKIRTQQKGVHNNLKGIIHFKDTHKKVDIKTIKVQLLDINDQVIQETAADELGTYSFLNLSSGTYRVRIDNNQLEKFGYKSITSIQNAVINEINGNDKLNRLDFEIINIKN
ncbi:SdrD B-like domain-containing protein [Lutibacter sp.]|uniref:SdrD B-like domain-containing protein n=1 Tax=Lutibacter sp. TaxID=1925666 RepID=UPI0025C6F699|nr:SdrD B-like domain-containing protein [Lutibacter sp.]MBT8317629.1 hypothetical protein [Lutibacter sp.]